MSPAVRGPALSIVVPVYDEEGNVGPLHAELTQVAEQIGLTYEMLFVNDGSRDRTLERLERLAAHDSHVVVVDLDGNFGEAAALSAGFQTARGDVVVTLDGDGQNDPRDIPMLLGKLAQRYDVVSGRRTARHGAFLTRVLPSWVANHLIVLATGVPVHDCGCGLKAYRREVVADAQLPRGMNRFLPAILGVDAGRVAEVETRDRPRASGSSHYGLSRVAVVFRDLFALPLLVRRPAPGRDAARALGLGGTGSAVLGIVAGLSGWPASALLLGLVAVIAFAIRHNVVRCADARQHGVFRVRRVLHGSTPTERRDRRSRILGQESAADLPQGIRSPGHHAVRSRP
jgi:hypothetical protein